MIVVVDDQPAFLSLMQEVLPDAGYAVRTCGEMIAAYDLIRTLRPDVILLDLHLSGAPRREGKVLLDLLQATPSLSRTPIIICSADRVFLQTKGERLRRKGCLTLQKPFELGILFALIEQALDRQRYQRALGGWSQDAA